MTRELTERFRECWSRSDEIFDLLEPDALSVQPITLRHPLIFYLGHLPAFAWNQVCRWRGARLATQEELHRAAYATPEGAVRAHPWGDGEPGPRHGNFDFRHWAPTPVGCFPDGDSAWGVSDLVAKGWEWTASVFGPFPGFSAFVPSYPGYSADFFDGLHNVMLGASWATPAGLIRRSFRNWFQRHYPYMFATFRCVW